MSWEKGTGPTEILPSFENEFKTPHYRTTSGKRVKIEIFTGPSEG